MKKLSKRQRLWLVRHQKQSFADRIAQRRRKAKRLGRSSRRRVTFYSNGRWRREWVEGHGKVMPEVFCLDTNFDQVAAFLNKFQSDNLNRYEESKNKFKPRRRSLPKWFDFATIRKITPAAALMMAAEFDRGRRLLNTKLAAIDIDRWSSDVLGLLDQLGLLAMLEVDQHQPMHETKDGGVVVLPFRSGDQTVGLEVKELIDELSHVVIAASGVDGASTADDARERFERSADLYHILIEAMNNVIEHAYKSVAGIEPSKVRRWWMTAAVDRRSRTLTVAIYDQGITVPVSLPNWEQYDKVKRFYSRLFPNAGGNLDGAQDGVALGIAMRVAVSSTEQSHRGKGFGRMKHFVDLCRNGRLRITSRFGSYIYMRRAGSLGTQTMLCPSAGH